MDKQTNRQKWSSRGSGQTSEPRPEPVVVAVQEPVQDPREDRAVVVGRRLLLGGLAQAGGGGGEKLERRAVKPHLISNAYSNRFGKNTNPPKKNQQICKLIKGKKQKSKCERVEDKVDGVGVQPF